MLGQFLLLCYYAVYLQGVIESTTFIIHKIAQTCMRSDEQYIALSCCTDIVFETKIGHKK